jgi:hypothetical protein
METISIRLKAPASLDFYEKILSGQWLVEKSPGDTLIVHGKDSRAYLYPDSEAELSFLVDYSDIVLVKKILEAIADTNEVTVDNDFGIVLPGSEFVARCRSDNNWDWRL